MSGCAVNNADSTALSHPLRGGSITTIDLPICAVNLRDMIYSRVGDIIKSGGIVNVIDAYSGIGIMSNIFAKYADKVYAVEIVDEAVEDWVFGEI